MQTLPLPPRASPSRRERAAALQKAPVHREMLFSATRQARLHWGKLPTKVSYHECSGRNLLFQRLQRPQLLRGKSVY